ncbi:psbQ-like protein 3, chloroplastic [Iris pallida]|uniref:PsbQ-like protein 3, chloroplastic n=1 Tax=Iris pallida TaxID=29817 RepID=A0AAX6HHH7_IRIPA|nr:psbQ-like protein 3, chloroplastic [Iris pallida]
MASAMSLVQLASPHPLCRHQSSQRQQTDKPHKPHDLLLLRRRRTAMTSSVLLLLPLRLSSPDAASSFELRLTVPDQTVEEAEATIRSHARDLLDIKPFLESESWREAQLALRESSAYLKQDIYTIIQGKPGGQRAILRKLYSELFNNVTTVCMCVWFLCSFRPFLVLTTDSLSGEKNGCSSTTQPETKMQAQ